MNTATIYISDKEVWKNAAHFAAENNLSRSELIFLALEQYMNPVREDFMKKKLERIQEILNETP